MSTSVGLRLDLEPWNRTGCSGDHSLNKLMDQRSVGTSLPTRFVDLEGNELRKAMNHRCMHAFFSLNLRNASCSSCTEVRMF